jgi:hypothetical protein
MPPIRLTCFVLDRTADPEVPPHEDAANALGAAERQTLPGAGKRWWTVCVEATLAFHRVAHAMQSTDGAAPMRFHLVHAGGAVHVVDASDAPTNLALISRFAAVPAKVQSSPSPSPPSVLHSALESACAAALKDVVGDAVVLDFVVVAQLAAVTQTLCASLQDALAVTLSQAPVAVRRRIATCQLTLLHATGTVVRGVGLPVSNAPVVLGDSVPVLLVSSWHAAPLCLVNVMAAMAADRFGGSMLRVELPTARAVATLWCSAGASLQLALARAQLAGLSLCRAETSAAWRADTAVVMQSHRVALHVADAAATMALLERAADRSDRAICLCAGDADAVSHVLYRTPVGEYLLQALSPYRKWRSEDRDDADDDDNGFDDDGDASSSAEDTMKLTRGAALRELVRTARLTRPGSSALAASVTGVVFADAARGDAGGVLPRALERATRYFPMSESHTLLYSSQLHDELRALLAPLFDAVRSSQLSEQSAEQCAAALRKLLSLCEQNDARFFVTLGDSARVRREAFSALWVELRTQLQLCATSPRHVQLVQLMETLWPEFAAKSVHDVSLPILADSLARTGLAAKLSGGGGGGGGAAAGDAALMPKSAARAAQAEREALASGKTRVKRVRRDEHGKPVFPINAKGANVVALGVVVHDRSLFHNEKYIWPVGFRSVRELPSLLDPARNKMTTYVSEIIDGGKAPMFRITPADAPNEVIVHQAPSGAWRQMLGRIKQRTDVSVSGPEMFGFSNPTVRMLIQELPNARLCNRYAWFDFDAAIELQETWRREHERLALQLDLDATDNAPPQQQQQQPAATSAARVRRATDSDAHLWRQYEEARVNAERDGLRAEYQRQSLETPRDFDAGRRKPTSRLRRRCCRAASRARVCCLSSTQPLRSDVV